VVSQELLDILRCPNCVRDGPEAGLLEHEGNWLICSSCDRKYPIRDDIPVMLIEEGDRFKDVAREELPEVPPPEEHKPVPATTPQAPQAMDERQKLFLLLAGLAAGAVLILLLAKLLRRDRSE
jgi:uncharacterized protein YbaR (Trm112 family)